MELLALQAKMSLPPKSVTIKVEFRKKTVRKQNEIWTEGQPGVCVKPEGGEFRQRVELCLETVTGWVIPLTWNMTFVPLPVYLSCSLVTVQKVLRDVSLNIQLNTITDFSPPIQWIWNQQQLVHSLTAMEIKTCMTSGGSATSVYSSTYPSSSRRLNLPKSPSMSQKLSFLRKHPYVY